MKKMDVSAVPPVRSTVGDRTRVQGEGVVVPVSHVTPQGPEGSARWGQWGTEDRIHDMDTDYGTQG